MTKERMIRIAYYYINYQFNSLENSIDEWEKSKLSYDIILHRIDSLVTTIFAYNFVNLIPETDVSKFKSRCDMLRNKLDELYEKTDLEESDKRSELNSNI